jgi:hypothetical protein
MTIIHPFLDTTPLYPEPPIKGLRRKEILLLQIGVLVKHPPRRMRNKTMTAEWVKEAGFFSKPLGAADAIYAGRRDKEMDRIVPRARRQQRPRKHVLDGTVMIGQHLVRVDVDR